MDDDIIQDVSPLEIPTVRLTRWQLINIDDYPSWWDKVRTWINKRTPEVLAQYSHKKYEWIVYFSTTDLYKDFIMEFPEVLRSSEDEDD